MFRFATRVAVAALLLTPATSVFAAEHAEKAENGLIAPSKAVAEAWAKEKRTISSSSKTLTALQVSYVALQGMDMWTTIAARNSGAREANPLMDGSYTNAMAFKAAMGVGTLAATKLMGKKNKKAAVITMFVLNGVTAAVVANNMRNVRR